MTDSPSDEGLSTDEDRICTEFRAIGLDVSWARRGLLDESIGDWDSPIGLIEVQGQSIRWVNCIKTPWHESWGGYRHKFYYVYIVPDPTVPKNEHIEIRTIRIKRPPVFGWVYGVRWEAIEDIPIPIVGRWLGLKRKSVLGNNLVRRLNEDQWLIQKLVRLARQWNSGEDLYIRQELRCWTIRSRQTTPVTQELWDCYSTIARYLLESSGE